jgi:hypothetical protein
VVDRSGANEVDYVIDLLFAQQLRVPFLAPKTFRDEC